MDVVTGACRPGSSSLVMTWLAPYQTGIQCDNKKFATPTSTSGATDSSGDGRLAGSAWATGWVSEP